jgi:hypothetical protein
LERAAVFRKPGDVVFASILLRGIRAAPPMRAYGRRSANAAQESGE